ncbi:response regulator [Yoonia sp. R2331]|uniref:response regulator n=1 Tax=Yoonia sp. R2331 TaxID=3237238 RepID=UPI0034E5742E
MTRSTTCSPPKVLYVEDEVIVALDVADGLSQEFGFEVRVAHNLTAAYQMIAREDFTFALLDMNLGHGERSTELGKTLAASGTHVVFASGYNRNEIDEIANFQLIEKPFMLSDIHKAFTAA